MTETKGTFTDSRDGKAYKTVKIEGQTWLAENLNFEAEGSKCYGDDPKNAEKYGRLYNWETAKEACPEGWHLPSNDEWKDLIKAAGFNMSGNNLKAKSGWRSFKGTDEFGFSALPGGYGHSDGNFSNVGIYGYWWSADEYFNDNACYWFMCFNESYASRGDNGKSNLFSVRCVQD
ncbi:MAG: fibrobacter succinogenes major paralogous domain-containing protein [Candidatus Fibromonas sp.]|jgi:uncharacterized protein (TIGR02145 family)|nr:fibrobacter succinogenes major paralogous domain-containing protein [Candidatus Fibromonas sp.]